MLAQPAAGQLRLRSTPRAFVRRPAACPSGFIVGITQTSARVLTAVLVRRCSPVTTPARSLPCVCPITTTLSGAEGLPLRYAVIGRPSTDRPSTRVSTTLAP